MNIIEALKIAKEQGKRVRPVGAEWFVEYDNEINTYVKKWRDSGIGSTILTIKNTLADWEVVKEKPSKETQHKIDSMKFQVLRHCANQEYCHRCILNPNCKDNTQDTMLDDWSLKEIVEAYHILKEAGDI